MTRGKNILYIYISPKKKKKTPKPITLICDVIALTIAKYKLHPLIHILEHLHYIYFSYLKTQNSIYLNNDNQPIKTAQQEEMFTLPNSENSPITKNSDSEGKQ
jgi:hypothetical protein